MQNKTLEECEIGSYVKVYCIGWRRYDDQISKVIKKDSFEVVLQSSYGIKSRFVPSAQCLLINF